MDSHELEIIREIKDFLKWVNKWLENKDFIENGANWKTEADKKFFTEVLPIRNFLTHNPLNFSKETKVILDKGCQSYDARLVISKDLSLDLQVTSTNDATSAFIRMHLEMHGNAPSKGISSDKELAKWCSDGKKKVNFFPDFLPNINEREISTIIERVNNKILKCYDSSTILIVFFNNLALDNLSDKQLCSRISKNINKSSRFRSVFITSRSRTLQVI